jgi:mono/diheme cytochrome c family protein
MKIRTALWSLTVAVSIAAAAGPAANAQTGSQNANQAPDAGKQQNLIRSLEGVDLYKAYCASCHGKTGKGDGPVAPTLKATVADLTAIAKTNGGVFPEARVRRIIMGEGMIASHGSREMPVWGPIFHQIEEDVDRGNVRLENLVKYLESIQSTRSAREARRTDVLADNSPSGAQLFKQLCAVCHGNDLKGNGPAPAPFKDVPPDLTTLARRHGGSFPDAYVSDVLRNGVRTPDHGPPEMPTWGADLRAGSGLTASEVTQRIASLSEYLKSQQAK